MIARPGRPNTELHHWSLGPNSIEIFSVFSEIKCKYVGRLAKGTLSPLYISILHFVQAAHKPEYYRRYSPSTVKSPGKDAVVFA